MSLCLGFLIFVTLKMLLIIREPVENTFCHSVFSSVKKFSFLKDYFLANNLEYENKQVRLWPAGCILKCRSIFNELSIMDRYFVSTHASNR